MIDIKKRIALVEQLVANGSTESLTYAALECRLTIEKICYDRLLQSHSYISRADLNKWTPAQVVKQIAEEANENVATGLTLSISKEPVTKGKEPKTQADYEKFEYVKVGQQIGFNISKVHSLWQALSKVALHINLPPENQQVSIYGNLEAIRKKLAEAVVFFNTLQEQTMIMGSMGQENSFKCAGCETLIRRNADLLKTGQVINCFNPLCEETYMVNREGEHISYERRLVPVVCKRCSNKNLIQTKVVEKLRFPDTLKVECVECGESTLIRLQLVQEVVRLENDKHDLSTIENDSLS